MSTVLSQSGGPRADQCNPQLSSKSGVHWVTDTTAGSLLHRLVRYDATAPGSPTNKAMLYVASIAITYLPLLLTAFLSSGVPLWTARDIDLKLPILRDWNMIFAFFVSFPSLVVLLVTDDYVLSTSLQRVQRDGVICISQSDSAAMVKSCKAGFFRVKNIVAQILSVAIGLAVGWATVNMYKPLGFWIAPEGRLLAVGYVYFYCIVLLYALITFYVLRCIAISVFLSEVVARATIHMLPFHPDKCGGLRPVGQLGLRNQYTLSILGLNIAILAAVSLKVLGGDPSIHLMITAAAVAYIILGPIVFMVPLLPFRRGMVRTKAELVSEVAQRLRIEFERLRIQIQTGKLTQEDEDLVDRLRKIGAVIDELPVWPFDAATLRKFASAYVLVPGFSLIGKALVARLNVP